MHGDSGTGSGRLLASSISLSIADKLLTKCYDQPTSVMDLKIKSMIELIEYESDDD